MSVFLVYLLLKTKIKPNTITISYGFAGILGGILLGISSNTSVLIALFIFFNKSILDWSDGHLARLKGETSLTGHILDTYGAQLNSLGLKIGLGFYVAQKSEHLIFLYLIPLIPFFYATNLVHYSRSIFSYPNIVSDQLAIFSQKKKPPPPTKKSKINKFLVPLRNFIEPILDDRARSVDFICFVILLELYFNFFCSWIILLVLIFKHFLIFLGSFYSVAFANFAENTADSISEEIELFNSSKKYIRKSQL